VAQCVASFRDVASQLTCIPDLTVVREVFSNVPHGYRRFDLTFRQPLDHLYPEGRQFEQGLVLWHRDTTEPMILHTSGYKIFASQLYLLANRWQTNQLQVTHRYFEGATPNPEHLDWSKLNIAQSAADFHRIVVALKQVYQTPWVNNGASKGGMTSVFTRRFYPEDFNGTVADVAPLSFAAEDPRYIDFVDTVGGSPLKECRERLRGIQRTILSRRQDLLKRINASKSFEILGDKSVAFEHAVVSLPFAFHQYHNAKPDDAVRCETIPADSASTEDIWQWLSLASSPEDLADDGLSTFLPYFYQANTELGGSADRLDVLQDLLEHPYNGLMYGPKGVPQIHTDDAMRDIENWVKTKSERIIFVYGEHDPWTAAMFPYRPEAESFRFTVAKGNHRAKYIDLDDSDKQQFIKTLSGWLGKNLPTEGLKAKTLPMIEDPKIRL
jgi:hypothetical protein